jgi:ABC-type glycerol-3-phosphate transport system substrate-binding protein
MRTNRFVLAGLCLLLAAGLVFAGGSKDASGGSAGSKEDFGGMNVVIGNFWADYDAFNKEGMTQPPTTTQGENIMMYRQEIQNQNNVKIQEKMVATWEEMQGTVANSIIAGSPVAQVLILQPDWAVAMQKQGLLYPISDITSVDFNSPLFEDQPWNKAAMESMTFGGKSYGIGLNFGTTAHAEMIYFNKRLFEEAGLDPNLPYDMQKDGSWTWDNFLELCKKLTRDTDNDGVIDTYAIAYDSEIVVGAVYSNGASYVTKDASGKFVNNTGTPEFLQALQFCMQVTNENVLRRQPEGSEWNWFMSDFKDGNSAMIVYQEWFRNNLADMADDWGCVLFPKGPNGKTYSAAEDPHIIALPATLTPDEANKVMKAYALWNTTPPANAGDPDSWKLEMYNYYRDPRAVDETLDMVRDPKYSGTQYYRYIPGLEKGDINWNLMWDGVDPAQLIESVSQKWDATINAVN